VLGFLVSCVYLIKKRLRQQKETVNLEHQSKMEDLAYRLLWYTAAVLITMIILLIMATWIYVDFDRVREGFSDQAQCEVENYYLNSYGLTQQDCTRTAISPPFLYILWPIACVSAVFAQVVLTCHSDRRSRLKRSMTRTGSKIKKLEQSMVMQLKRVRSTPDGVEVDGGPDGKSPGTREDKMGNDDAQRNTQVDMDRDIILPTTFVPNTSEILDIQRESMVGDIEITQFQRNSLKLETNLSSDDETTSNRQMSKEPVFTRTQTPL